MHRKYAKRGKTHRYRLTTISKRQQERKQKILTIEREELKLRAQFRISEKGRGGEFQVETQ